MCKKGECCKNCSTPEEIRQDLIHLLDEVKNEFTHETIVSYKPEEDFCEYQKEYGQSIGITLCGELNEREEFEQAYYFPYFEGSGITTFAEIVVERKIEKAYRLCNNGGGDISVFHRGGMVV